LASDPFTTTSLGLPSSGAVLDAPARTVGKGVYFKPRVERAADRYLPGL